MAVVASSFRWLQRKKYQYEVTFSLYMLTPTEKFIFNSFLFLFCSMMLIAMTLYLPQHVAFLINRGFFYYNGDDNAKLAVQSVLESSATTTIMNKIKETVVSAGTAAGNTISGAGKEL